MNKKDDQIKTLIDEALKSLDNVERANPMPFLQTRFQARLNRTNATVWEKVSQYIGRPSIAISGLAVLIFLNVLAIMITKDEDYTAAFDQQGQAQIDEFSYSVSTIYELENNELK